MQYSRATGRRGFEDTAPGGAEIISPGRELWYFVVSEVCDWVRTLVVGAIMDVDSEAK